MDYFSALSCIEQHLRLLGFSQAEIEAKMLVLLARARKAQTGARETSRGDFRNDERHEMPIGLAETDEPETQVAHGKARRVTRRG